MATKNPDIKRGNVKLLKDHPHGGLVRPAGTVLENLRPDQIARLVRNRIGTETTEKPAEAV